MKIRVLMAKIVLKEQLSESVYKMNLEAKLISEERKAGQFIILQVDEIAVSQTEVDEARMFLKKGLDFQLHG